MPSNTARYAATLAISAVSAACAAANDPAPELLRDPVPLTSPDAFLRAGEAYFDHHTPPRRIVFQATPRPPEGGEPSPHYSMYVADLVYDGSSAQARITGIEHTTMISPPGSASTCGWFHPDNSTVLFASTLVPPSAPERPGYQRGTSRYTWQFPSEMDLVTVELPDDLSAGIPAPTVLLERPGYDAECSFSPDGRHVLFASVVDEPTRDLDLFVHDTGTGKTTRIVEAPGYDGGPFFSPDGRSICYRSDREGNNLLQVFTAGLVFDDTGSITGITEETQHTNNEHVNWAPYFYPSGGFLVYTTSRVSHRNYEVFAYPINTPVRSDTRPTRITVADGFDGLPVFSDDGAYMMWTSQRETPSGISGTSQVWVAHPGFYHCRVTEGDFTIDYGFVPLPEPPQNADDAARIVCSVLRLPHDSEDVSVRRVADGWTVRVLGYDAPRDGYSEYTIDGQGRFVGYSRGD